MDSASGSPIKWLIANNRLLEYCDSGQALDNCKQLCNLGDPTYILNNCDNFNLVLNLEGSDINLSCLIIK